MTRNEALKYIEDIRQTYFSYADEKNYPHIDNLPTIEAISATKLLINNIYDNINLVSMDLRNKFMKEIDLWEEVNSKENPASFVTATKMRSIVEEYYERLFEAMDKNNCDKPSVELK